MDSEPKITKPRPRSNSVVLTPGEAINKFPEKRDPIIDSGSTTNSTNILSKKNNVFELVLKRINKKILVVGFVFIFVLILFVSVFAKFRSPSQELVDRGNKIIWWGLWEEAPINALISEYKSINPNYEIIYEKQNKEVYSDKLKASLGTENGPDIFDYHNTWTQDMSRYLFKAPKSVFEMQEYGDIYYPVIVNDLAKNGAIIGLPLEIDTLLLFINRDVFSSALEPVPETWDEFRESAIRLTQRNSQGQIIQGGVSLGNTENVDHWQEIIALLLIQNGVDLENPVSGKALDALKYYSNFATSKKNSSDKTWDESLPSSTIAFQRGEVAMYFAPTSRLFEIRKNNPQFQIRAYSPPQVRRDDPNELDTTYATYWVEGVWNMSGNRNPAWEFLKYLSQKESLQKFYFENEKLGIKRAYPRMDMADLLINEQALNTVVSLAPGAKSWYIAGNTHDGSDGINAQISSVYKRILQLTTQKSKKAGAFEGLAAEIKTILTHHKAL